MWPCTAVNTQPLLCTITLQPVTRQPLPQDHYWCCSAIGWCHKGPLPQATNCQWVTVSGPGQPLVSAIVGLYPRWPLVVLVSHWSAPQWAPSPADQLSMSDCPYPISGPAQPLVGATVGPPQATNCQWVTVSGPAQPLVSDIVGLYPKWPLVVLVSHWSVPQWAPPPNNQLSVSDS